MWAGNRFFREEPQRRGSIPHPNYASNTVQSAVNTTLVFLLVFYVLRVFRKNCRDGAMPLSALLGKKAKNCGGFTKKKSALIASAITVRPAYGKLSRQRRFGAGVRYADLIIVLN